MVFNNANILAIDSVSDSLSFSGSLLTIVVTFGESPPAKKSSSSSLVTCFLPLLDLPLTVAVLLFLFLGGIVEKKQIKSSDK